MNADDKIESPYYDSSIPRFKQLKMMRHSEMVIDGGGLEVQQYHNYKDWYLKDQNGWQYVNTQDLGNSTELAWVGNGQDGETGPPIAGNAQGNGGTWDPVTNQRISQLDSRLQGPATDFINAAQAQGVNLRITQGYRTIAEQNALYNQGRTTPGNIVTPLRGGQSYHNYGLAIDVVIMKDGQAIWDPIPSNIGALGVSFGFEWGGNWSRNSVDYPHFQMTFGQSILDLQKH